MNAFVWYGSIVALLLFDRVTKLWAMTSLASPWFVNSYLTLVRALNRGVSWSFFSFKSSFLFALLTSIITVVTVYVCYYAWQRHHSGNSVYGELLVIGGSVSNIIDRVLYGGVVDFVELSYQSWSWPVFNIADVCIIGGVIIMVYQIYCNNEH